MIDRWYIIEVFGHQKHAGYVSEVTVAGVQLLLVEQPGHETVSTERDIYPSRRTRKVTTRYPDARIELGGAAIFRRVAVTEEEVRAALRWCTQPRPGEIIYGEWEDPAPALPGPVEDAEEVGDTSWPQPEDQDREWSGDEEPETQRRWLGEEE